MAEQSSSISLFTKQSSPSVVLLKNYLLPSWLFLCLDLAVCHCGGFRSPKELKALLGGLIDTIELMIDVNNLSGISGT